MGLILVMFRGFWSFGSITTDSVVVTVSVVVTDYCSTVSGSFEKQAFKNKIAIPKVINLKI